MEKKWVLMTNDDGIEAPGFEHLVKAMNQAGIPLVAFAPSGNKSACSMQLNLGKPIDLHNRNELIELWNLDASVGVHLFALDGTPCDTMIVALDGGLKHVLPDVEPSIVLSGVNLGPNLSQDSYHSGTMGAAREAGLYGIPAIASSYTSFDPVGMHVGIDATVELLQRVLPLVPRIPQNLCRPHIDARAEHVSSWPHRPSQRTDEDADQQLMNAFLHGELMLNLNVPPNWNGSYQTTRLGMRWYREAVQFVDGSDGSVESTFTIGAAYIDNHVVENGDVDCVETGFASISSLPTWPQTHPLALDDELLAHALRADETGHPSWFKG
ncbi:MAG: 5'/3'-nucleotidase SurE [Candidatus Thermoplasmatota archaeon]|nr:5'/3'-nucleotidase SurE [Candidatus Thermoplasmatota archaeon]MEC8609947.1 5'/3'-nucleotidase SurE [Candidatus Thermoplasmatota archaeon]